jgi:uncharacterized protein (UPF0276 family)
MAIQPGVGVGVKPEHFHDILATRPDLGFFEIHAENYLVAGGPFHHWLTHIREHYALSVHGVGLSIGGAEPPDEAHLDALAADAGFELSTLLGLLIRLGAIRTLTG